MPAFNPELIGLMRTVLEEVMTRVPAGHATPAVSTPSSFWSSTKPTPSSSLAKLSKCITRTVLGWTPSSPAWTASPVPVSLF